MLETVQETHQTLGKATEDFLVDRLAQGLTHRSVQFYREKLQPFLVFAQGRGLDDVLTLTPAVLREFMLDLAKTHNPGGIHSHYRSLRAFLRWFEAEYEPPGWTNPIKKVKAPRLPEQILAPAEVDVIRALLAVCPKQSFTGSRDRAILLTLYDTGLRASELLALVPEDVNPATGQVRVRRGKGGKPRTVFLSKRTRAAIRTWMRYRPEAAARLFVTVRGEPLAYQGLRFLVVRRARAAGVQPPPLHSFRRAFALTMLRLGTNVYALQQLMGHADLGVLRRYLRLAETDLAQAHKLASPVDNMAWR